MAVVVKHSRVLMQKRFRKSRGMVFEFPGGSIDSGESAERAAVRELSEETGLNLKEVIGLYQYDNEYGGKIHFVILRAISSTVPVATDPLRKQTFFWFSATEVPVDQLHRSDQLFVTNDLKKYFD